jgi:RNA polymerase sigma factor (sigma-70 family)
VGRDLTRTKMGPGFDSVLLAAQAGSAWALERLYHAMAPAVVGYLRVQGASDPDDLTNDVFLDVLTKIRSFRGHEEQFRAWVFTIAHSRLVDARRRASRRPQLDDVDVDVVVGGDVESDALRRLSEERVRQLCERLVPEQRDVLLLRLMAGLSISAIAAALGKSEGAVKALQRRGLANLRKTVQCDPVPL